MCGPPTYEEYVCPECGNRTHRGSTDKVTCKDCGSQMVDVDSQ